MADLTNSKPPLDTSQPVQPLQSKHPRWYASVCHQVRDLYRKATQKRIVRATSVGSISNAPELSVEESIESVEELSPSQQFNWTRMTTIFNEYQAEYVMEGQIVSMESIRITKKILDLMLLDEDKVCEGIYDSIMLLNKNYAERYFYFSSSPKIRPKEHMIQHLKKLVELHRILATAFADDTERALQIINLLVLSHLLMRVELSDFKLFDLAIGKFLYRINLLDDTNVHHVVGYFATVTGHVERLMHRHDTQTRRRELLLMDIPQYLFDINSVYRENYRDLKKWHQIRLVLRKIIADREEARQVHDDHDVSSKITPYQDLTKKRSQTKSEGKSDEFDTDADVQDTKLIIWLKKGYKYKARDLQVILHG